jgi:hypothetical protein
MSALMHAAQSRLNTWLGPAANKGWGDKALRSALGPAGGGGGGGEGEGGSWSWFMMAEQPVPSQVSCPVLE